MTFEKLSAFSAPAPFVAFEPFLSDGRSIRVRHPDFLSLDPAGEAATIYYEDSNLAEVIDLLGIISLQYSEEK
jgi:hypothetical protein